MKDHDEAFKLIPNKKKYCKLSRDVKRLGDENRRLKCTCDKAMLLLDEYDRVAKDLTSSNDMSKREVKAKASFTYSKETGFSIGIKFGMV